MCGEDCGTFDKISKKGVCIYKNGSCTKPSVGFGTIIKGQKIIFVGSHLPINPKEKSLGYDDRVKAMKKIKTEVIDNIAKTIGGANTIFWGGDMNFRIIDKKEQLSELLANDKTSLGFGEHDFTPVIKNNTNERNSILNTTCRLIELTKNDYSITKSIKRIHDTKRSPSYCDRILFQGNFEPSSYKSWPDKDTSVYPESIAYSDHEPVVLEGNIIINTNISNAGMYKINKSAYLRIKNKINNLLP